MELGSPSLEGPVPPTDPKGWTVASERRHASPRAGRGRAGAPHLRGGAGARNALRVRGRRCRGWGSVVLLLARALCSRCPGTAPKKKGGGVAEGGGGGGVRASAALFPTFPPFVKVGSARRGEAPARAPDALGGRAGGASSFSPCSGRGTQKLPPKEVRARAAPLHLFQILEGGIREAERGARAGPVRSVGGRGVCVGGGGRRSPPFARDSARPRAPERLVCEGVGCGAGCGTRCGAPAPRGRARGAPPPLVAAPEVAQYPGGGRHKPLLAPSRVPGAAGRRRSTSQRRAPAPNRTHCLAAAQPGNRK